MNELEMRLQRSLHGHALHGSADGNTSTSAKTASATISANTTIGANTTVGANTNTTTSANTNGNTNANANANANASVSMSGSTSEGALARGGGLGGQQGAIGILYKELSYSIVGAAIEVHRHIGPGQLESTYERALGNELARRGIPYRRQVPLTAYFKGDAVGEFYADMIVDDEIILELKSVNAIHSVHRMQLLSYLRASGLRLGLLINFNAPVLWRAITRIVR